VSQREKTDARIKRMVAIETAHRHALRRAEDDLRRDVVHRSRYERKIEKEKRKLEKLLPRLRRLREHRTSAK